MSIIRRLGRSPVKFVMAEELRTAAAATATATAAATPAETTTSAGGKKWTWPSLLRWIPTSTDHIIASEKRLLSLVKYAVLSSFSLQNLGFLFMNFCINPKFTILS